jgi:hypothetical protein
LDFFDLGVDGEEEVMSDKKLEMCIVSTSINRVRQRRMTKEKMILRNQISKGPDNWIRKSQQMQTKKEKILVPCC